MVNQKDIEILEFPKVREILAGYTSFSASRDLALNLLPSSDYDLIDHWLRQSYEARRLLALQPSFSVGDCSDVREMAHWAAKDRVLDSLSLVKVKATLASGRYIRTHLRKQTHELPLLWSIAEQIVELPYLEQYIGRSISSDGEILDSASTELSLLRTQIKDVRRQLLERLDSIVKSPKGRKCLQDDLITERYGRYVVPLKVNYRSEMKGIVHDISNTGATVFVEPWAIVNLGNELREAALEERREVERILRSLSYEVGINESIISDNVNLITELDLALAKARFADFYKATEPSIGVLNKDSGNSECRTVSCLRLVNARHPLLTREAIPLSVEIGDDYSVLVITGPNTGGKTVALKTIGLLTLMTQSGIPIPASPESYLPVLDGVYADIGDEQSIEHTLSTFSWHMNNIVRILRSSGPQSLVLLDELGTSTDPHEGAALAQAILTHCLSRGSMTIATTHYGDLKVFAHATHGMRNASLDFDPVTLAPTYHLTMGIPGGSNALAMAAQLGLPDEIVDYARKMLTKGTRDVEALISDLNSEKLRMEGLRHQLEQETEAARTAKSNWEDQRKSLKEQEQTVLREMIDKLTDETADLQREVHRATKEIKKVKSRQTLERAEKVLMSAHQEMKELASQLKTSRTDCIDEEFASESIAVGDEVWLRDMDVGGTVLSLREEDDQLEVQVGHTRLMVGLEHVEKVKGLVMSRGSPELPRVVKQTARVMSLELDLRGRRADDVARELDKYLNDASLAHLSEVRIIHGFGTGTVRQIVRETLATHPLVKGFRPGERGEGGDGITMVVL
ncbi:MAG: endonuclease MutS2 [Chloroflexota bacterium]|nr:endonuclease MutS2 [Chloroflexota bacterium]